MRYIFTVFHRTTGGSNVQAYAANKDREEEDSCSLKDIRTLNVNKVCVCVCVCFQEKSTEEL